MATFDVVIAFFIVGFEFGIYSRKTDVADPYSMNSTVRRAG